MMNYDSISIGAVELLMDMVMHSQFTAEEIKLQVAQVYRMNQWQRLNSALGHLPPLSQILAKAYRKVGEGGTLTSVGDSAMRSWSTTCSPMD